MIGIGWFQCRCRRTYAGFSRGDVTSKCHGCQVENLPSFILPGDKANKDEKSDKKHFCNACKGSNDCPVIAEFKRLTNENLSTNILYNDNKKVDQLSHTILNKNILANAKNDPKIIPNNNRDETINKLNNSLSSPHISNKGNKNKEEIISKTLNSKPATKKKISTYQSVNDRKHINQLYNTTSNRNAIKETNQFPNFTYCHQNFPEKVDNNSDGCCVVL